MVDKRSSIETEILHNSETFIFENKLHTIGLNARSIHPQSILLVLNDYINMG